MIIEKVRECARVTTYILELVQIVLDIDILVYTKYKICCKTLKKLFTHLTNMYSKILAIFFAVVALQGATASPSFLTDPVARECPSIVLLGTRF
jgi:hypothetical protein